MPDSTDILRASAKLCMHSLFECAIGNDPLTARKQKKILAEIVDNAKGTEFNNELGASICLYVIFFGKLLENYGEVKKRRKEFFSYYDYNDDAVTGAKYIIENISQRIESEYLYTWIKKLKGEMGERLILANRPPLVAFVVEKIIEHIDLLKTGSTEQGAEELDAPN